MGVNIYCEPLGNHKWINGFGIEVSSTKGCPSPSMSFSIISYICQFGSRNILKSGYILVQFCYKMLKSPILGDFFVVQLQRQNQKKSSNPQGGTSYTCFA